MKDGRPAQRFRLAVLMLPMIALALASFWLLEVMRRTDPELGAEGERSDPDFYVETFSLVKMSKTGQVQYHMAGARLTHNPQDDSYDVVQPVVKQLGDAGRQPILIQAERAHVNSDASKVHLHDQVLLERAATADREALRLRSDYLLLLPEEDVMKTDLPVEITSGRSRLSGVGMLANNNTRVFELSSRVHGTYQAPAR